MLCTATQDINSTARVSRLSFRFYDYDAFKGFLLGVGATGSKGNYIAFLAIR